MLHFAGVHCVLFFCYHREFTHHPPHTPWQETTKATVAGCSFPAETLTLLFQPTALTAHTLTVYAAGGEGRVSVRNGSGWPVPEMIPGSVHLYVCT